MHISRASEISPGEVSGGTNTSHTIGVEALAALLAAVSSGAPHIECRHAATVRTSAYLQSLLTVC